MRILSNPILGKIFAGSSLRLNEKGLKRRIAVGNRIHMIHITDNLDTICRLLGLRFEHLDKVDEVELYEYITTSPKFSKADFMKGRDMSGSTSLTKFVEYLNTVELDGKREHISTEEIESMVVIDLRSQIDDAKRVLGTSTINLDGGTILKYHPDIDKTQFPVYFKKFHDSFETYYHERKFLLDTEEKDMVDYFVAINKITTDAKLLNMYMWGFNDELDERTRCKSNNEQLEKAYHLGKAHAIIGDDVTSMDGLTDGDILKLIKNEE